MPLLETRVAVRNILFATDFSDSSYAAVPYVETIARRNDATVFVAHVLAPSSYAHLPAEGGSAAIDVALGDAERKIVDFIANSALRSLPHRTTLLLQGDIAESLRDMIERCSIDLLVLGTHGRKGLSWFIMGSIAEHILKRAPCPVLIVGPRAPHDVSRSARLRRILYATDFTHESLAALDYALDLAQEYQSKLTLLTVLGGKDANGVFHDTLTAAAANRLRKMAAGEVSLWCEPEIVVDFGDAAERIREHTNGGCDLIVLGGRTTAFPPPPGAHKFGSVTHKVITDAPCAVLSVPEHWRT